MGLASKIPGDEIEPPTQHTTRLYLAAITPSWTLPSPTRLSHHFVKAGKSKLHHHRRLHGSFGTARGMKLRMKNEEMEELDYRPLAFGSCSTPSVLRAFRQRLFLGAIGGYAALNLILGFLRNQLLLEQIFGGTKPTSIDDALSIVGTDAGQRG